jgi:hypothetical protein
MMARTPNLVLEEGTSDTKTDFISHSQPYNLIA